jgi:uncharacterized phiE125 gp8 family phage protein
MLPLLIAGPALEPLSLSQTKIFLKIDGTDDDDLVTTLITAARLMVEASSGRVLVSQTWRLVLDEWPYDSALRLPVAPVSSIAAARVFDAASNPQVVAANVLVLEQGNDPPLIRVVLPPPPIGRLSRGLEIDVVAGFGPAATDVPAPLRQAVLRLVARWFENRGDVVSRDSEALPGEIAALIRPYKRIRL